MYEDGAVRLPVGGDMQITMYVYLHLTISTREAASTTNTPVQPRHPTNKNACLCMYKPEKV